MQEDYKRFVRTKTYVVRSDNPFSSFNIEIADAMRRVWTLTQWEMISTAEFEIRRRERESSFIFLSELWSTKEPDLKLDILNVVLGTPSGNINNMPDVASIPLCYVSDDDEESDEDRYLILLPVFLRFVQYYIRENVQESKSVQEIVKKNHGSLLQKEIWFLPDQLSSEVNTVEKISSYYKGKVKIVSEDELEQAIEDSKKNVVVAHIVAPKENKKGKALKILIEISSGLPYYYDLIDVASKRDSQFTVSDFRKF